MQGLIENGEFFWWEPSWEARPREGVVYEIAESVSAGGLLKWDKPLWDDTGDWFKAPTLRSVGTIVSGIAASILVPGSGLLAIAGSAAVSTASTIAFDALDVGYGYKSWEEAGLDIGKQFLSSVATAGIGSGFKEVGELASAQGMMSKAILAGAQTFTTNVARNAINSFNLHGGWGMGFDTRGFMDNSFGESALISSATSAVGAGVTAGLTDWNMQDGNSFALSKNVFDTKSIESFNSLAGGLAGNAFEYGFTGKTTFNLARLSGKAVDGSQWGSGLLEMHVGDGFSMNFGTSGTDISLGTIGASMSGLYDTTKITGAKASAALGDVRGLSTFNAINMMGYTTADRNYGVARDIWSGAKKVTYYDASTAGIGAQDLNALGYAEGTDTIGINAKLLGSGKESAAQIASLFAHEGMHLAGEGEINAKIGGYSAYGDLMHTFGVTGAGYEQTGIAQSTALLQKYGTGAFSFIASAQIAAEGQTTGTRQYEQAAVVDPEVLRKAARDRAIKNLNDQSGELQSYLTNSSDPYALILGGSQTFNAFTSGAISSENYADANALLSGLKDALKDSKESVAGTMYSHDMLQYTTRVLHGSNGYDGLSGALFMEDVASGRGTDRGDNPFVRRHRKLTPWRHEN